MTLIDLPSAELRDRLCGDGLRIATGPFNCRIRSAYPEIAREFAYLYAHHPVLPEDEFIDFHIAIEPGRGLRRWFRPQARFLVDGVEPFTPLPRAQALPMIEWGLNWCITAYSQHVLILHAAALALNDRAIIMPAPAGSGKSTLCAALVSRGWRLLSDELTIIDLASGTIAALARPINLKNESIRIIGDFAPDAFLSAPVRDTSKGTVALMAPPADSVLSSRRQATPCWMILPQYAAGAATALDPMMSGAAFLHIADNAMNYHVLGERGFAAVGRLIDQCRHFSLEFSDLEEAITRLNALALES